MNYQKFFLIMSIIFGLGSAFSWFYASQVKISRKKAVAIIEKRAKKKNEKPNLSGISFDGWDFRETLRAQAKWNSIGAVFASISMIFQVIIQLIL